MYYNKKRRKFLRDRQWLSWQGLYNYIEIKKLHKVDLPISIIYTKNHFNGVKCNRLVEICRNLL